MGKHASILVKFILYSQEMKPAEVTESVGIIPPFFAEKGEVYQGVNIPAPNSFWELESRGKDPASGVEDVMDEIIVIILPKRKELKEIILKNNLNVTLSIVIIVENFITPSFFLNRNHLKLLDYLNAEIDVDIYVNPPD